MGDLPFAKKGLGQHWLTDATVLHDIVAAADVTADDEVLEIGPGLGTLTDALIQTGAHVTALEYDQDLIKDLQKKFKGQATIIEGDIRTFDFGQLPRNYKIVANIPYYLTANLFRALIDTDHKPAIAALLVQKEVAERVAATPGKMSFVAVALQLFYEVRTDEVVPAHLFTPPPKVDSQVVIFEKRLQPLFSDIDTKQFFRLVKAGFSERRKKLKTSLKSGVDSSVNLSDLFIRAKVSPDARAQELSLEDWHKLYRALP